MSLEIKQRECNFYIEFLGLVINFWATKGYQLGRGVDTKRDTNSKRVDSSK